MFVWRSRCHGTEVWTAEEVIVHTSDIYEIFTTLYILLMKVNLGRLTTLISPYNSMGLLPTISWGNVSPVVSLLDCGWEIDASRLGK